MQINSKSKMQKSKSKVKVAGAMLAYVPCLSFVLYA